MCELNFVITLERWKLKFFCWCYSIWRCNNEL